MVSAHQPQYMPYLGYLHKMKNSDVFVILDDVQFKKNEWQNRNRVKGKTPTGEDTIIWLTVPVIHNFGMLIKDVKVRNDLPWQRKHKNTLITYYSKAPNFHFIEKFNKIWEGQYQFLIDVNMDSIRILMDIFDIKTKIVFSSELKINQAKTDRLVAICKELGAKIYLSGQGAYDYLEVDKFKREGIEVVWQDFKCPVYPQLGKTFIPNLSSIDIVLVKGEECKNII